MNDNNRGGNCQAIDAQPFSAESQFAHLFSYRLRVLLTDDALLHAEPVEVYRF